MYTQQKTRAKKLRYFGEVASSEVVCPELEPPTVGGNTQASRKVLVHTSLVNILLLTPLCQYVGNQLFTFGEIRISGFFFGD